MTDRERFADVVDIAGWVDSGAAQAVPLEHIQSVPVGDDHFAYLQAVWAASAAEGSLRGAGERIAAWRGWMGLGCTLLGFVVGGASCGVALAYDGRYPVNLLALLGLLVLLPFFLLCLSVCGLAARRMLSARMRLPSIFSNLTDGWLTRFGDALPRRSASLKNFSAWQVLAFSNRFYLGFFIGALTILFFRVTFTDLAFGWSSTLDLEAADVERVFAAIAWPWAAWLPGAAPDAALVEASRFYRLDDAGSVTSPERLGDWWPFVAMALAFWGLLPRALLAWIARLRLARAERALVMDDPRVTALLDGWRRRGAAFDRPETRSEMPDVGVSELTQAHLAIDAQSALIVWNSALSRPGMLSEADWSRAVKLGGRDEETIVEAKMASLESPQRVVIFTKAFDAPVLASLDFFDRVRARVGAHVPIEIVPVGVDQGSPMPGDREVWALAIERHGDAHMFVALES